MVTVEAEVQPHGAIKYTLRGNNVGINGEDFRDAYANSFEDLWWQLKHTREWSEKNPEGRKRELAAEQLFAVLSDPRTFKGREDEIGHMISCNMFFNEVVQIYLDWGGAGDRGTKSNCMVNMWAEKDGTLRYIINNNGRGLVEGTKFSNALRR
jgi:hypothetical protein